MLTLLGKNIIIAKAHLEQEEGDKMSTNPVKMLERPYFFRLNDGRVFFVEPFVDETLSVGYRIISTSSIATDSIVIAEVRTCQCEVGKSPYFFNKDGESMAIIEGVVSLIAKVS